MFGSRLFWKVTFNFAILLLVIFAMAFATVNVLNQIGKSYHQASMDMAATSSIDRIRSIIEDARKASDDYLYTGISETRIAYDTYLKFFDSEILRLQKLYSDSNDLKTVEQVRNSFYDWVKEIGDKKILLASSGLSSEKIGEEIQNLGRISANRNYLGTAKTLLQSLYSRHLRTLPTSIEYAISAAEKINNYIILVNILLAIFAIVLGFILSRSIIRPVEKLRDGTQNIVKGIFKPIELNQRDELGILANDFNYMSRMLQQNYSRLTAYSELMTALNKHESLDLVQQTSLQILCLHTGASVGALYLLENSIGKLRLAKGYALSINNDIMEFELGKGLPGQCAITKEVIELNNIDAAKSFIINTGLISIAPSHILAAPIMFQENLIGVIVLGSMEQFDDIKKEIINNSLPQIGIAIMNAMNLESTKRLSIEIAEKNKELNAKNIELQKAYRVKSDFLSNMSHELRTPLNSIIGFTSVLLDSTSDPLSEEQRKALEKVLRNGKHLLELINDILDYSKIESGRVQINIDFDDVENIVYNAMITIEPMLVGKNVRLEKDIEPGIPRLHTDVLKVKQILLNLLSNAAKFTDEGEIKVTASKQGDMVAISVKDTGIGIEEKNLEKIFEEFSQIDSGTSRKYKGTGLGLPIARNYARMLGGDLTVQSQYGKGSTFTLIIPPEIPADKIPKPQQEIMLSKPPQTATVLRDKTAKETEREGAIEAKEKVSNPMVLCIDDNPEVIELMKRFLIPEGYSVQGALSGDEGIRMAQVLHPAVITLDIMMPEKDGWQVLRELKSSPLTKDIPVIIHSIVENRPLALSLGALEVITKPSDPRIILEVIERACRSKSHPILIVDDDQDFADYLKKILEDQGYEGIILNNGEEALKNIDNINPSVLFLDLMMPGIDGFGVLKQLRSKEKWKDLPIVVVSGVDVSKEQREDINRLSQKFIEKGQFSKEMISSTIRKIINQTD